MRAIMTAMLVAAGIGLAGAPAANAAPASPLTIGHAADAVSGLDNVHCRPYRHYGRFHRYGFGCGGRYYGPRFYYGPRVYYGGPRYYRGWRGGLRRGVRPGFRGGWRGGYRSGTVRGFRGGVRGGGRPAFRSGNVQGFRGGMGGGRRR